MNIPDVSYLSRHPCTCMLFPWTTNSTLYAMRMYVHAILLYNELYALRGHPPMLCVCTCMLFCCTTNSTLYAVILLSYAYVRGCYSAVQRTRRSTRSSSYAMRMYVDAILLYNEQERTTLHVLVVYCVHRNTIGIGSQSNESFLASLREQYDTNIWKLVVDVDDI